MSEQQTDNTVSEVKQVLRRRRTEALDAGLSWDDANTYAESTTDTQKLRDLVASGCPEWLIAKILL